MVVVVVVVVVVVGVVVVVAVVVESRPDIPEDDGSDDNIDYENDDNS